jgi:hypothetical protein
MNLLARSARAEFSGAGLGSRPPGIGGLDEPCGAIGRALSCDRVPGRASRGGGWKVVSRGGSGAEASGGGGNGWEVVCRGGSGAEATGAGDGWGVASRGGSGAEAFGIGGDRSAPSIAAAPNALPGTAISPSSAAKTWSDCANLLMPLSLRMGGRPGSVPAAQTGGPSGILCAAGRLNRSGHAYCGAFAEQDGELALAMDHSRSGMIHSFSERFNTRTRSFVAASSLGNDLWPEPPGTAWN